MRRPRQRAVAPAPARCPGAHHATGRSSRRLVPPACPAHRGHARRGLEPVQKRPGSRAIHHVHRQAARAEYLGAHRHAAARQAGRSAVDEDVVAHVCIRQAARMQAHPMLCGPGGMAVHNGLGLLDRAVGHDDLGRPRLDQRAQHAGRCTSGPQQQHAASSQRHARIHGDVAHQAHAIGVVSQPATVGLSIEAQRVGGLGQLGPRRAASRQLKGLELEGHRHVAALGARSGKRLHLDGEGIQRAQQAAVVDGLPGLLRKQLMDVGRAAVGHGVAGHGIAIRGGG